MKREAESSMAIARATSPQQRGPAPRASIGIVVELTRQLFVEFLIKFICQHESNGFCDAANFQKDNQAREDHEIYCPLPWAVFQDVKTTTYTDRTDYEFALE
jgi:hypothetical protein